MKKAVLPFLTIPEELIAASPWEVELSTGKCFTDPEFIEEWDNGTDIRLRRTIDLDFEACCAALCCPRQETELEVLVTIGTGAGSLPVEKWISFRAPLISRVSSLFIELEEAGTHFADVLHIETTFILSEPIKTPQSHISPVKEGSVLWQERKRIRIEGDAYRFPVSETNLELLLGSPWKDALWYLHVEWEDCRAPFDSAVRLHVNSLQRLFAKRFREGDPKTVHIVMADVITQIASGIIELGDEWELGSHEVEDMISLGQVALYWLESAFGTIEAARQAYKHAPGRFHASINALAAQEGE